MFIILLELTTAVYNARYTYTPRVYNTIQGPLELARSAVTNRYAQLILTYINVPRIRFKNTTIVLIMFLYRVRESSLYTYFRRRHRPSSIAAL